eukprot:192946-Hanusia_phi.AAC.1
MRTTLRSFVLPFEITERWISPAGSVRMRDVSAMPRRTRRKSTLLSGSFQYDWKDRARTLRMHSSWKEVGGHRRQRRIQGRGESHQEDAVEAEVGDPDEVHLEEGDVPALEREADAAVEEAEVDEARESWGLDQPEQGEAEGVQGVEEAERVRRGQDKDGLVCLPDDLVDVTLHHPAPLRDVHLLRHQRALLLHLDDRKLLLEHLLPLQQLRPGTGVSVGQEEEGEVTLCASRSPILFLSESSLLDK